MSGPLPAVPKAVRIDHHFSTTGTPNWQTREFFQYNGVLSVSDAQTWINAIGAAMANFVVNTMSNQTELIQSELTDLSSPTSPQEISTTSGTGSNVNPPLTAGTALCVRKHILRLYRGGHPRVYFGGRAENELASPTQWTGGVIGTVKTDYDNYIAASIAGCPVAAAPAVHINISYFAGFTNFQYPSHRIKPIPTPRPVPVVDLIVATSVNPTVASQRRRNRQSQ